MGISNGIERYVGFSRAVWCLISQHADSRDSGVAHPLKNFVGTVDDWSHSERSLTILQVSASAKQNRDTALVSNIKTSTKVDEISDLISFEYCVVLRDCGQVVVSVISHELFISLPFFNWHLPPQLISATNNEKLETERAAMYLE